MNAITPEKIAASAYAVSVRGHFEHKNDGVPLLQVRNLAHHYALPRTHLWGPRPQVTALQDINLTLHAGQSLGIVGASGSGKSTLARLVMALDMPSSGRVLWAGQNPQQMGAGELRRARRHIQMVFQDPFGALDPRQRIARTVAEPLAAQGDTTRTEQRRRAAEVLEQVGLRADALDQYPHEFSGGQRQRIAIARALITRPRIIVADEPVSALDVSVQAQVLNLMQQLARDFGVTYLLISHDLAVVNHLCDEVAVLHQGRIVEQGPPAQLFQSPTHPYTRALVAAMPLAPTGVQKPFFPPSEIAP
jgi:peptide/nickel transport system ATP-binding protein